MGNKPSSPRPRPSIAASADASSPHRNLDPHLAHAETHLPREVANDEHTSLPPAAALPYRPECGHEVHQYELIRELDKGGMGVVWLARDRRLGRRVALKFLHNADSLDMSRFLVEARSTASLQHENIVVVHEVNTFHNNLFMVLELLDGQSLRQIYKEEAPVHPLRAVELLVPVVRALEKAHAAGLVHRDLKPDNVFLTRDGVVKVLDFGIVKLMQQDTRSSSDSELLSNSLHDVYATMGKNGLVGTIPYMPPEQCAGGAVDHRTDLYAVGVMFFELLTGRHPWDGDRSIRRLVFESENLDKPLPSVTSVRPDVPEALATVVDCCLRKRALERPESASELLQALDKAAPHRLARAFVEGENPYRGLRSFQEDDATRFFGRDPDVARGMVLLQQLPLVAVLGPSGVGKSSYVRAGLLPALKASGQPVETLVLRPGRSPLHSLASILLPLLQEDSRELETQDARAALSLRLLSEPGLLGSTLRDRARNYDLKLVLFVDQFEELYTLTSDASQRRAFTRCLAGVADDTASPLRVVLSMRSDLLGRAAEDASFVRDLTRGMLLLRPLDHRALHAALTRPAELAGYRFESDALVTQMLQPVQDAPGGLPLLQFAAARLWENRDQRRKLLTQQAHDTMGGVEGTLATHANQILAGLTAPQRETTRALFLRLVTPERTRALVSMADLTHLGADAKELEGLLHLLADARLLVLDSDQDMGDRLVEIVHESLITSWPALRHWLDAASETAVFAAQLQAAAKQWDERDRSPGLVWRGDAAEEALRIHRQLERGKLTLDLAVRERQYLDAVHSISTRTARLRRALTIGALFLLSAVAIGTSIAMLTIRKAEQEALANANRAVQEATRARTAESKVKEQLRIIQAEQAAREKAERDTLQAILAANLSRAELEEAFAKLRVQWSIIRRQENARKQAQTAAQKAQLLAVQAEAQATAAAKAIVQTQAEAAEAKVAAVMTRQELEKALARARHSLAQARSARQQAEAERVRSREAEELARQAAERARESEARIEALLAKERTRAKELEKARSKIATELK